MYETDEIKMYAAIRADEADRKTADKVMNLLREEGIAAESAENLSNANTSAAVVFFSKAAVESGSAKRHYGSAKKGGALIVPVVLDDTDVLANAELNRLLGRKEIIYAKDLSDEALIRKIVYMLPTSVKYNKPEEEEVEVKEIPTGVAVGTCPVCGSKVRKGKTSYDCESPSCDYSIAFECTLTDPVDPDSILTKRIKLDNVKAQTLLKGEEIIENVKSDEGKVFKAKLGLDPETKNTLTIVADKRGFSPFGFKKRK